MPWGGGGKFVGLKLRVPPRDPSLDDLGGPAAAAAAAPAAAVVLPPGIEPLVLWEPPAGVEGEAVRVDDMLTQVGGGGAGSSVVVEGWGMGDDVDGRRS